MGSPRQRLLLGLILAATIAGAVANYAGAPDVLSFVLSAIALAGLAWVVSAATESVGRRFGPGVTGVLQASLGNLPELFVVLFALRAGQVVVAQTSILGSLFATALLIMGLAFFLLFFTLHLAAMRNEIMRRRVRTLMIMQAQAAAGA